MRRRGATRWGAWLVVVLVLAAPAIGLAAGEAALRISQGNDLTTGDPHQTVTVTDYNVLWHVYKALARRDQSGEFVPWLASS